MLMWKFVLLSIILTLSSLIEITTCFLEGSFVVIFVLDLTVPDLLIILFILMIVIGRLNTNNFIFLFFYFSDFILIFFSLFFYFSFGQWRGTWHHSHMTGHMMWCHRPRTWWKDLEDDVRAYVYNMVALSKKWGEHKIVA